MTRIRWENLPSTSTPLIDTNLNKANNVVISSTEPNTGEEVWLQKGKNLFNDQTTTNLWSQANTGKIIKESGSNIQKISCQANQTFTIKATFSGSSSDNIVLIAFYDNTGSLLQRTVNNTTYILTATAPTNTAYMYAGHYIIKPSQIQLEYGSTATSYEEFKPHKIYENKDGYYDLFTETVSVGNTAGSGRVSFIKGKNLLDENKFTSTTSSIKYIPIKVQKNTDYTLSTNAEINGNSNVFLTTQPSGASTSTDGALPNSPRTKNSGDNEILYVGYRNDMSTYWAQLEKGSTATSYEPYVAPAIVVDGEEIYNKSNQEIYSTEETRIGTWIDGKPLYRKVFYTGNMPNNTSKELTANLGTNIIRCRHLYGACDNNGGYTLTLPFIHNSNINNGISLRYDNANDKIVIITGTDYSAYKGYIIMEYTKTTD